jgi:hypothetical protein
MSVHQRQARGWFYEADGNIKTIDTRNYSYDAAGNQTANTFTHCSTCMSFGDRRMTHESGTYNFNFLFCDVHELVLS